MGKRCLQSRPRGPVPKISPARKGWVHRQPLERRRCGTTLFVCSLGPKRTQISDLAELDKAACVPFFKERRMMFAHPIKF
jgi:hypothetical protein